MKFSHRIERCALSPIRKFHPYVVEAEAKGRKVYHLNIGQPDIETPEAFFRAIADFDRPVVDYAPSPGVPDLVQSVQEYYAKLGISLERGDILTTFGGSEALQIALSCILEEGDDLPEPFYPNYATFINMTGAVIRPVPTSAAEEYRYARRELLEPLINEHTRAVLITDPGNPTGVVLNKEERRLMADIAREHGLWLISDEVYRELIYRDEPLASMLEMEEAAENVIVVDSVSKRFSATGARVGMLISRNQEFMGHAMKIAQGRLCAPTLDQVGAAALYQALGEEYYHTVRQEYRQRRDVVLEALSRIPGVKYTCPEGAFYLMATLPVENTEDLQYFLLQEFQDRGETVMYAPGEGFYATAGRGRNEIRIAYVTNPDELRRAVELLGLGIAAYRKKRGEQG